MPTATPLIKKTKPDGFVFPRLILWLALVPAFGCLYIGVPFLMMNIGQAQAFDPRGNTLLETAAKIAPYSPNIQAAMARYERARALEASGDDAARYWQSSMQFWQRAMDMRPDWPYLEVGMLDAEIFSGQPDEVIQARVQHLITVTPNETAMDYDFLPLAFSAWRSLSAEQQEWVWQRLPTTNQRAWNRTLKVVDQVNLKWLFCLEEPVAKRAGRFCKMR